MHQESDKKRGKCEFCGDEFEVDKSKGHRANRCGSCRDRITQIRKKLRLIEKSDYASCRFCGYSRCKSALDFHHKDQKTYTVGQRISSKKYDELAEEVEKCVLVCSNCHEEHHSGKRKSCECGDCKSCSQRQTRKGRKRRAIDIKGGTCESCGYDFEEMASASFHHTDPDEKKFNLSGNNFARSWEIVESEIRKCQLLCENCHRIEHCKGSKFCEHETGRFSSLGLC